MYDLMNAGEFYVTANDVEDEELVERAPDMSAR